MTSPSSTLHCTHERANLHIPASVPETAIQTEYAALDESASLWEWSSSAPTTPDTRTGAAPLEQRTAEDTDQTPPQQPPPPSLHSIIALDAVPTCTSANLSIRSGGRPRNHDSWRDMFSKLCEFVAQHGDTNVPYRHEDRSLAQWVKNQRALYRRGILEPTRQRTLESIAFLWSARDRDGSSRRHMKRVGSSSSSATTTSTCHLSPLPLLATTPDHVSTDFDLTTAHDCFSQLLNEYVDVDPSANSQWMTNGQTDAIFSTVFEFSELLEN